MNYKIPPTVYQESSNEPVLHWYDNTAKERLWLIPKIDSRQRMLIVRHAGNSIWYKGASIHRKKSDLYGIELVTAGNLRFVQDGREYIVESGHAFIKRRGSTHFYEPGPAGFVHKRFVRIDGSIIETIVGELGIGQTDVCCLTHPTGFSILQKRAISLLKDQSKGFSTQLSLLALEILLFVSQDISGISYPPALSSALEYIHRNLNRKISITKLSEVAMASNTQLFRLFKLHIGEPPLSYINKLKIKRGAELLKHSIIPIKEIAYSLGYEEHSYFTNQFRLIMGISPREYRNRM